MSVLGLFRLRGTAPVARERLHILLSHERSNRGRPDLLAILRDEILAVVAKHVSVDHDQVHVTMDRGQIVSRLEINVELQHPANGPIAAEREKAAMTIVHQASR